MYFYEILASGDKNLIIKEFLKLFDKSVDFNINAKSIADTIETITELKPNLSENYIIYIEEAKDFLEEFVYDYVYISDKDKSQKYGMVIKPWADTIGYIVDDCSLKKYGVEKFAALVLWEMTWFGYDEKTIQAKVKSWNK